MIFDILICNILLKKKFDIKHILVLMSSYYLIIYTLLYFFIFKKAFAPQSVLIPCLLITIFFFIYRITIIKKYIESIQ